GCQKRVRVRFSAARCARSPTVRNTRSPRQSTIPQSSRRSARHSKHWAIRANEPNRFADILRNGVHLQSDGTDLQSDEANLLRDAGELLRLREDLQWSGECLLQRAG